MNCLTACVERPLPDQPVPFLPQKIVHYRDHEQCLAHQGLFVERAALHPPAFSFIGKPFRSCLCQFLCDSPVRSLSIAHCVPLAALPLTRLMQCRAMNPATTAPQLRYLDELYLSAWRNRSEERRVGKGGAVQFRLGGRTYTKKKK